MPNKLKPSEIELIVSMYEPSGKCAREAERILRKKYFHQELNFTQPTIRKYWRLHNLKIGSVGGHNNPEGYNQFSIREGTL